MELFVLVRRDVEANAVRDLTDVDLVAEGPSGEGGGLRDPAFDCIGVDVVGASGLEPSGWISIDRTNCIGEGAAAVDVDVGAGHAHAGVVAAPGADAVSEPRPGS